MSQVFASMNTALLVRKHPAPEGALRHLNNTGLLRRYLQSESTQHQKVH